jgi:hypothetical protein
MNNQRPHISEEPYQSRIQLDPVARGLVQCDNLNIVTDNSLSELSDVGESDHGMPIAFYWHVVDEIDNAVL